MNNIFLLNDSITNGFSIEVVDLLYLISVMFALITIMCKNPVVAVLFLIGLFVNIAGLLILVGYSYMGLSYILVYVGAVSILFLFILMLINIRVSELHRETNNDIPLAFFVALLFYGIVKQALPWNTINNNLFTNISNTFFAKVLNIEVTNELSKVVDLKQQIGYVSSKGWDSTLIEPTHIASIGNIMYTSYSMWLIVSSIILLLGMVGAIVITIKQK